jgi:hypothetical protein
VSWDNFSKRFQVSQAAWDTHERNFPMLKETLLPGLDQTYSAFLADLDQRGLLEQTLVVMMGEMGRTPKVNAKGGRITGPTATASSSPAPASAAAALTANPTKKPPSSRTSQSTSATSSPRSITASASTPKPPSATKR